ncbi:hypothetical protein [Burkholderia ubonensis]|uniref:hypothetical protein n=1 Tax=Burkholderia ubonensis TaxID=101571 RepID=UPI00075C9E8F|nr:hypothetical protein [Burkholderia ubonensis]KVP17023.1 hypothetical protein WJ84_01745 [Burkholderia ubonensis]
MDMMKLKQAAAALRIWIDENRSTHRRALKDYRENGRYRAHMAHETMLMSRARLEYLVPMYRALLAASQQSQTVPGGEKGAQAYLRRFLAFQQTMLKAVLYPHSGKLEQLFGDGLLTYPLLVPDERVAPYAWQFRTINDLLEEVRAEQEAARQAQLKRARKAEDARKGFLASLTPYQVLCLKAALAAAKEKGTHAITIDERDLETQ